MSVDADMPRWRTEEWARWAGLDAPTPAKRVARRAPARRAPRTVSRLRVATGIVTFAFLATLLWLVPYRVPGELADADLQPIERPLCAACPASQLITAAGVRSSGERQWLTIRFAAPPQSATFDLVGDLDIAVTIAQRADGTWVMSAPPTASVVLTDFTVGSRGERAVFELPAFAASGVALRSPDGVRFPAEGTLPVRQAPGRALNIVDLLVAALALAGAWRGFRAGAFAMVAQLVALAVIMAIIRAIGAVTAAGISTLTMAFAYGAAVAITGIAVHVLLRRVVPLFKSAEPRERGLGSVLGMLRAAVIAAMLLAVASDQALVDAVSATIEGSISGAAIVGAWRALLV